MTKLNKQTFEGGDQNQNVEPQLNNSQRRQFLTQLFTVIGVGAASSLLISNSISSAFAYQRGSGISVKKGQVFNLKQMAVLHDVCETILPKTDTPSAAELDCHGFVDHQLMQVYTNRERSSAINVINNIDNVAQLKYGKSFSQLTESLKQEFLNHIEKLNGFSQQDKNDFKQLKALIVFGFFTTEIGVTQALNYQPVPGGYKGSIPCDENTKSWGSIAFY